jgi:ferric-dicitrate binding protein FerR (iron transport regulator)
MTPSVNRRDIIAGSAAAGLCWPLSSVAQPSPAGTVRALSGSAQAQLEAAVRQLAQNASVFVGDRISTGSGTRASLALGAATELRLGAEARIRIDRFLVNAGGVINLEKGSVFFDRDPARETGPVNLRSTYGLIAVRGTRFFAGPSEGVFGVFVQRGSVALSGGGRQVLIGAGEGSDVARPGARPSTPRVWSAERLRSALALVS